MTWSKEEDDADDDLKYSGGKRKLRRLWSVGI